MNREAAKNLQERLVWCKIEHRREPTISSRKGRPVILIIAENIVKRYGAETALDHVNIAVKQGEIACIIGPNGSGKSTLLSVMAGLLRPDGGTVYYQGKAFSENRGALRQIGFVPQQDSLFADLSVKDNLSFWAAASNVPLSRALNLAVVQQLELGPMLRKRVKHLSGGMRRRVAIAAALVSEPLLLILDEPFAGLDLFHKSQLTQRLRQLRESGVTIIYTSHNADEIVLLSDTMYLLHKGKIALHKAVCTLPVEQAALNEYLLNLVRGESAQ